VVKYKWNKDLLPGADDTEHVGVIAQDLQQVRPDLVGEKDGYLTVDYEQLLQEVEEDGSH
jgi:hypothetical protein